MFALDIAVKPDGPLPLTILLSGLYFRTETGGLILLGKSLPEDPVGFNFSWDEQRFNEILWPELAEFVPAWDRLKLVRGWAGLYDVNTLDRNALIGEWPEIGGLYLATGFSGARAAAGAGGRPLSVGADPEAPARARPVDFHPATRPRQSALERSRHRVGMKVLP